MKDLARIYRLGNKWKADYLDKTYTFLGDMPLGEVIMEFNSKNISIVRETNKDSD